MPLLTVKGKNREVEEMIREALSALFFYPGKGSYVLSGKVISPSTTIGEALLILMVWLF